jgi:hypothetical protein
MMPATAINSTGVTITEYGELTADSVTASDGIYQALDGHSRQIASCIFACINNYSITPDGEFDQLPQRSATTISRSRHLSKKQTSTAPM